MTSSPAPAPADEPRADGRSGHVVVRLRRDLPPGSATDLRTLAEELGLDDLAELLDALGGPPSVRLVTSVTAEDLIALERRNLDTPFSPVNSLTQYWRVDATRLEREIPLDSVAEMFAALGSVEAAYVEDAVTDPAVNAANDPLGRRQGYLGPAPDGIDARWAWLQPGGDGQDVGVVDVEQTWLLGHQDLQRKAPIPMLVGDDASAAGETGDHGAAVLGVIAADDDTRGVIGIAPNPRDLRVASHFRRGTGAGTGSGFIADAVAAAARSMRPGDVLVVEAQRGDPALPVESDEADRDAIRLATALGVVVVEAAGNGGLDLDGWAGKGKSTLNPAVVGFVDSGAIMVGAARSSRIEVTDQDTGQAIVGHARMDISNGGARVNCYAWGERVTTAGYGDLSPASPPNASYTSQFRHTSSAAAIVAGAAVLTQSMRLAATGGVLSPPQLRRILAAPPNGTPQCLLPGPDRRRIGHMPDLRKVALALGVAPDVYLRDAVGDHGTLPSAGTPGESPDVICAAVPVADAAAAFGQGSGTAEDAGLGTGPVAGQDSTVYVRMRNRGAGPAVGVSAHVFVVELDRDQRPWQWPLVGTTAAVDVPGDDTIVVAPGLTWPAAAVPTGGPHALLVLLDHARDPLSVLPEDLTWDDFLRFVRNTNGATLRTWTLS